jgi:hypothetical protein
MSQPARDSKDDGVIDSIKLEDGTVDTSGSIEDGGVTTEDESKYITGRKLYLINTGLIVSVFIVQMESTIVSTAIVDITDDLGGYEKSSWLFTAFLLTYCSELYLVQHILLA